MTRVCTILPGVQPQPRRRGTAVAYLLVILSVLITGLMSTMGLTVGTQTQMASLTLHRDQAFYAAEAGIQNAYARLQLNGNWRADASAPLTGTVGSASYSVTAAGGWNSPVLISAVGTSGAGSTQAVSNIAATVSPTSLVPAISLGNNFDNNGNVVIVGDVQAKGNVNSSGRFRLSGSIEAGGSVDTKGSVDISGTTAQNVNGITIPVIDVNALVAQATQVVHVPQGGKKAYEVASLNFGNGGIIYFDGPISFKGNVSVQGQGTLVVNGDIQIQSAASFGSSSNKALANIVTTGNADVSGYLGIIGSLYVGGTLTKNGGFDVTGVIVANSDLDTAGGMNITRAQPPFFDPRANSSGSGTMVLTTFTGPIF